MSRVAHRLRMAQRRPRYQFIGTESASFSLGVTSQFINNIAIGSPAADRIVIVAIHARYGTTYKYISDFRMGGVDFTRIVHRSIAYTDIEFWWGIVPNGETVTASWKCEGDLGSTWINLHIGVLYGNYQVADSVAAGSRTVSGLVLPSRGIVLSAWCEDNISPSSTAGAVYSLPNQVVSRTTDTGSVQSGLSYLNYAPADTYGFASFWYLGDTSASRPAHIAIALTESL